jgi:hypothetical protein
MGFKGQAIGLSVASLLVSVRVQRRRAVPVPPLNENIAARPPKGVCDK